ncbi:MAG: hypothetical protein JSR71_09435 [Proteobacteria bacterium]|nr:hypothetical protein [Pseudomonadota bacterium]
MSETGMDLKGAQHGGDPKTVTTTATSFGAVTQKGRYQIATSGADIYIKPSTSKTSAETVAATGATRGKLIWDGNTAEVMLDAGDYVGVIAGSGTAIVNLDYMRSY